MPTMKSFSWKIAICLIPVLLAGAVVGRAYYLYQNGRGGFKLGVDLVGGTDLIYEIDTSKLPDGKLPPGYSPQTLAASLKRRIDPADLYNVTIRPVSGTRVEIILPTGGAHQLEAEESVWQDLIKRVENEWPIKTYKVPADHKTILLAQINAQHPKISIQDVEKFIDKYAAKPGAKEEARAAAWQKLLTDAAKEWPPKSYQVGRGQLQMLVEQVRDQYPDVAASKIGEFIDQNYKISKERRHLTGEEVQNVKELISRVGSLEFRILANVQDDKEAIDNAIDYFSSIKDNAKAQSELEALAVAGKPPPAPRHKQPDGDPVFNSPLSGGSRFSYSWVELGPGYRRQLSLDNAAETDPIRSSNWKTLAEAREKHTAVLLGPSLYFSRKVQNPRLAPKDQGKKYEYFVLTRDPEKNKEISGKYLVNAYETQDRRMRRAVGFRFNQEGGNLFYDLTSKNAPSGSEDSGFKRNLAIILDNQVMSAPSLNAKISTEGIIEGDFTQQEVSRLVNILRSGQLPATLKPLPVSENTIGATLGADTIYRGTVSVIVAFAAIMAFMIVYYRFAGLVACVALLANLVLTVAFMVLVNATFTLPGLAGLVLMLGMAVDANVLIYERLREERDRGAGLALAIRNGYDRAFPTIIDTHLSSIFTAIVLYVVGNDQLKGFGISLTVGLIISLFTSLYMTRLMFDLWLSRNWLHNLSMFRLFSRPSIDFMAIRYYWFTATLILTIFGAAVFLYRLDKGALNIDFFGGTAYTGQLTELMDIQDLRRQLQSSDLPDLSIQLIFVPGMSEGNKSKLFNISTSNRDAVQVQQQVNHLLGDKLLSIDLKQFVIGNDNKTALLTFTYPHSDQPAFASRAQVSLLLTKQFTDAGLESAAQQFALEGLGRDEDGRFQWMELRLPASVERSKLQEILSKTQKEFASQPQPERLENFDSQLASETQTRAMYAVLASWGAILLYLWFRFGSWTFGLAAVFCLIHDLFFTLGIIAFCHYIHASMPWLANLLLLQDFKIDLPTVAALLTLVGYSVNDTIVVFDRIREVRGKNPDLTPQMINDSVNQTLSRTLLTAFSVWLVVIVLFLWGGEGVHLFAFVMVVGVFVGTYSSIYIASPLLLMFGEGKHPAVATQQQTQRVGAPA